MALVRTVRRIIIINVHRNDLSNQVIASHPLMQAVQWDHFVFDDFKVPESIK